MQLEALCQVCECVLSGTRVQSVIWKGFITGLDAPVIEGPDSTCLTMTELQFWITFLLFHTRVFNTSPDSIHFPTF